MRACTPLLDKRSAPVAHGMSLALDKIVIVPTWHK
ncbi:MAG: hypothetical protein RLZZ591_1899 [Pseudomonadota bacterium]|jgi:hypothetical protein